MKYFSQTCSLNMSGKIFDTMGVPRGGYISQSCSSNFEIICCPLVWTCCTPKFNFRSNVKKKAKHFSPFFRGTFLAAPLSLSYAFLLLSSIQTQKHRFALSLPYICSTLAIFLLHPCHFFAAPPLPHFCSTLATLSRSTPRLKEFRGEPITP